MVLGSYSLQKECEKETTTEITGKAVSHQNSDELFAGKEIPHLEMLLGIY